MVPTTGVAWLVITSVFVLGEVPELLSGGCSVKNSLSQKLETPLSSRMQKK
jgi:hypothetical protein